MLLIDFKNIQKSILSDCKQFEDSNLKQPRTRVSACSVCKSLRKAQKIIFSLIERGRERKTDRQKQGEREGERVRGQQSLSIKISVNLFFSAFDEGENQLLNNIQSFLEDLQTE